MLLQSCLVKSYNEHTIAPAWIHHILPVQNIYILYWCVCCLLGQWQLKETPQYATPHCLAQKSVSLSLWHGLYSSCVVGSVRLLNRQKCDCSEEAYFVTFCVTDVNITCLNQYPYILSTVSLFGCLVACSIRYTHDDARTLTSAAL